jgi:hypothetical protein
MKEMFDKIIIFFNRALKDVGTKFTFRLATPIKWPNRCAVCNKNPDEYYNLYGRVLKGKYFGGMSPISLFTLRYPLKIVISFALCRSHSFQMDCMKILSFCSFVSMLLFAILTFAQLFDQESQSPWFYAMIYFLISIFSFVIYNFSLRRLPVRLIEVGDIFFTIAIKDKDYAKEFASVNDYHHNE